MPDLNHANHDGIQFTVVGGELRAVVTGGETQAVDTSRALTNADHDKTLLVTGNVTLTLPDTLRADFQCLVMNVGSGIVSFATSGAATALPSGIVLDNTVHDLTAAVLKHASGGAWYVTGPDQVLRAPASKIITVATTRTMAEADDGAIVHLADQASIDFSDGLPDGWGCIVVRDGATGGSIVRSAGHQLFGPSGDAASYDITGQYLQAAVHSRGSDILYVAGAVQ